MGSSGTDMIAVKNGKTDPSPETILLLSDKEEAACLWESLFAQKGCLVFREPTVKGAFDFLGAFTPSVIIVDMLLSPDERILLCRQLRICFSGPILLLLADTNVQQIMDLYQAGADECLLKPDETVFLPVKTIAWIRRYRWMQLAP
jgi:two-component system response regulator RstA